MLSVLAVLIEGPVWEVGNGLPLSLRFLVSVVHQCVIQKKPIYQSASEKFENLNCIAVHSRQFKIIADHSKQFKIFSSSSTKIIKKN